MKKATREFIKARQPFADQSLIKQIEGVNRIGGGIANECYKNSWNAKQQLGGMMISGWLVQKYNPAINGTGIIQHWWNLDKSGNHFDTSPITADDEEYVQDFALYQYCVENDSRLETHVAKSLFYQNGKYSVLMDLNSLDLKQIDELKTEHFYVLK